MLAGGFEAPEHAAPLPSTVSYPPRHHTAREAVPEPQPVLQAPQDPTAHENTSGGGSRLADGDALGDLLPEVLAEAVRGGEEEAGAEGLELSTGELVPEGKGDDDVATEGDGLEVAVSLGLVDGVSLAEVVVVVVVVVETVEEAVMVWEGLVLAAGLPVAVVVVDSDPDTLGV
jgi:hypothetical protein